MPGYELLQTIWKNFMNKKILLVLATLILPLKLFGMDEAAATEYFPAIKIIKCKESHANFLHPENTLNTVVKWISTPEDWVWSPRDSRFYLNRQLNFFREEKGYYSIISESVNIEFSLDASKENLQITETHPQARDPQAPLIMHSYALTQNFSFVLNSKNWLCYCLLDNIRKIELLKFSRIRHYDFPEELNRGISPSNLPQ